MRVLISTGTRTLQDQLFNKDLPQVAGAIGACVTRRGTEAAHRRVVGIGRTARAADEGRRGRLASGGGREPRDQ